MRARIFKKLFLSHFLAILLVSGSIGTFFYAEAARSLKHNLQIRLMSSASLISHTVDAADLREIRSPDDIQKPEYLAALSALRQMRDSNNDIAFLYIMRRVGDELQFVIDSDETGEQALPGTVYPEQLPSLLKGFVEPSYDEDIFEDEWGSFMSGYAPLKNGNGEYLVGIDMRANEVKAKFRQLRISGLISLTLSIILALIFSRSMAKHFNRSIQLLVEKCRDVALGKYGHIIEARTNDELDDLIHAFNHMSVKIETIMGEKRKALDALEKANAGLEQRVNDRTRELTQSNEQLRGQIEETRKAQQAAFRAESQLLQAHKLETIGSMAGGIAHDFNNLMMGVVGNADLVMLDEGLSEKTRAYIEQMKTAGLRTRELTLHLLTYAGKTLATLERFDINRLIRDIEPLLRGAISRNAILEISPSVGINEVRVDHSQMRQVIMNLVINASEALPDGRGIVAIRTGSVEATRSYFHDCYYKDDPREGTYVYIEVEDNGAGISKRDMDRIFDPFFSTKYEGRGLGLAVVVGVIRAHHGAIKVSSESGSGSRFTIFLPAMQPKEKSITPDAEQMAPVSVSGARTILVVDDEVMVCQVAVKMLEAGGYTVLSANGGGQAIEIFKKHSAEIGLIVLDWTMPDMGGESVIQTIREMKSSVPILIASGFLADDIHHRLAEFNVAGFLQKPYSMKDLLAITAQYVSKA